MGYPHKPHSKETLVLSKHFGEADARTYKGWVKRGGYEMLAQALTMEPARVIDVVKESGLRDRKSTRLNSSHSQISYAVFCLKKKRSPRRRSRLGAVRHSLRPLTPYRSTVHSR